MSQFARTTPSSLGMDAAGLSRFLDACRERGFDLHSIMVALDGEVVAEGWAEPYSADGIQLVYSCSKSFTALAAGLLVTDGVLDVGTKVLDHLPWAELETGRDAVDPLWEELTLEHCLSMTVGHEVDAWGMLAPRFTPETDFIDTILSVPPQHQPGTRFCYNQVATYLAARVVEDVAGEPLLDLLRRRFFEPLDVGPAETHVDPRGRALGFSGCHVRTEALLALAQLHLDEGRWRGEQLLAREWVARAREPYGPPDPDAEPGSEWALGYGFSFWKCTHGYRGDGAFGQFALVLPEQRLAIAITSETEDMQGLLEAVWEHVLPAVGRGGTAEADLALAEQLATLEFLAASEVGEEPQHAVELLRAPGGDHRALPAHFDRAILQPDGQRWLLTLHERGRAHVLPVADAWQHATLDFGRSRLPVATRGGWQGPECFSAQVVAFETPHRVSITATLSSGEFTADFHLAPLGGTDPQWIGLPGTGGRAGVAS